MGTIVVNDTNIFIDLISVDLLDEFSIYTKYFIVPIMNQFMLIFENRIQI